MQTNEYWMRRCLALARRALGNTSPNPMVGSIVLDAHGKKVGEGFHQKAGCEHAETFALQQAGKKSKGGTLYVNLEPCSIQGKQPPCTKNILKHEIKKVVVGCYDYNPLISGQGVNQLRAQGVEVIYGCLEQQSKDLNKIFFNWILNQRPFVTAKVALTKNSFMGIEGKRVFISDPLLEKTTMKLRAQSDAILIGVQTANCDDPQLNIRGKYHDRKIQSIVLDPHLRIHSHLKILSTSPWILCMEKNSARAKELEALGATLIALPSQADVISWTTILNCLAERHITSLLIEGGRRTMQQAHQENVIHQWVVYQSERNLPNVQNAIAFDLPQWPWTPPFATRKIGLDTLSVFRSPASICP